MHQNHCGQGGMKEDAVLRVHEEGRAELTCMSLPCSAVEVMASSPAAPSANELSWRTVSADSLSGDLASASA